MKKLFLSFVLSLTLNLLHSQTFLQIEQQTYFDTETVNPYGYVWATHYTPQATGLWVFSLVSNNWGELLAGPNYSVPVNDSLWSIDIGVGGGIETVDPNWRTMTYIFARKKLHPNSLDGCFTILLNFEYGASGIWYLGYVTYNLNDLFAIGVHAQGDGSWGPKAQFELGPFSFWVTPGYNLERDRFAVVTGVRITQ